jgi:hypothetical protein
MKVKVLTFKPNCDDSLEVFMSVGTEEYKFRFTRTFDTLAGKTITMINDEPRFWKVFKFNQHIVAEVIKIVRQIYRGENVDFPRNIGDFGTPKDAIALPKNFPSDLTINEKNPQLIGGLCS